MKRAAMALLAALLAAAGLVAFAACTPIRAFSTLVPEDGGAVRVARDIAYAAGPRHGLDIYAPRAAASGPRAVIVFFYGGSWNSGDKDLYGWVGRALAARGFVVVLPDYRLVPEVRYPDFLRDCADAVRWVRANAARYGGDPDRLVLAGHSAGAYNAAMLALDPEWLGADRAAVRGFVGLAGPYDFLPLDIPVSIETFGRWPRAGETQPITYATAGAPPALLLHGADDRTVLPRNSERLAARLKAAGDDVTLRIYPRLAHIGIATALSRPFRGRAPVLADMAAFARRVTGR